MTVLKILSLGASLGMASPALSEPYALLIYESADQTALRADEGEKGKAYWGSYADFAKQAGDAGVMRGGGVLHPAEKVSAIGPAGAANPHDGASDLKLGGYFEIDVASMAEAEKWARKVPAAATGRVEIRGGFPAPGM